MKWPASKSEGIHEGIVLLVKFEQSEQELHLALTGAQDLIRAFLHFEDQYMPFSTYCFRAFICSNIRRLWASDPLFESSVS